MGGVEFSVVDTGGMDEGDAGHDSIERQMLRHTKRELQRADVIFFIVDGRSGLTQDDIHFSRSVVMIVCKVDRWALCLGLNT
jgi:GTP-binding protein